jgi:hypothetical protein
VCFILCYHLLCSRCTRIFYTQFHNISQAQQTVNLWYRSYTCTTFFMVFLHFLLTYLYLPDTACLYCTNWVYCNILSEHSWYNVFSIFLYLSFCSFLPSPGKYVCGNKILIWKSKGLVLQGKTLQCAWRVSRLIFVRYGSKKTKREIDKIS